MNKTICKLTKDIVSVNKEDEPLIFISNEAINLKRNNDELKKEIERLQNIIEKARSYINKTSYMPEAYKNTLLDILDKENK